MFKRLTFSTRSFVVILVLAAAAIVAACLAPFVSRYFPPTSIAISTAYPNASVERLESELVNPIEGELINTRGLLRLVSVAREGSAEVVATYSGFSLRDTTELLQLVRGAVLGVKVRIPDGATIVSISNQSFRPGPGAHASGLDATLIAVGAMLALVLAFALSSGLHAVPKLESAFERLIERYHDTLARALQRRRLIMSFAFLTIACVLVFRLARESSPLWLPADRAKMSRSTDVEIDVHGTDAHTLDGFTHRLSDEITRVAGISDVRAPIDRGEIRHLNRSRWMWITARLTSTQSPGAMREIRELLDATRMPPGYHAYLRGSVVESEKGLQMAALVAGVALLFIYALLAARFRSFLKPLPILVSLLFVYVGVELASLFLQRDISMWALLGALVPAVIVICHGARLQTLVNRKRRAGALMRVSLVDATRIRLHSVFVTSAVALTFLMPIAVLGSVRLSEASTAAMSGLVIGTIAVLFVTPAMIEVGMTLVTKFRAARMLRRPRPSHSRI